VTKKLYSITIRGNEHTWSFDVMVDPRFVEEWRADGIEIDEICNVIPEWIADLGITRLWCFVQDLFHFRNPFKS
jgi:hypothetical protein